MKRVLLLALVLLMVLPLAACGDGSSKAVSELNGTKWYIDATGAGSSTKSIYRLQFENDKVTCINETDSHTEKATLPFKVDGNSIVLQGESIPRQFKNLKITYQVEDGYYYQVYINGSKLKIEK